MLKKAIEFDKSNDQAYYLIGNIHFANKQKQKAHNYFSKVVDLKGKYSSKAQEKLNELRSISRISNSIEEERF